MRDEDGPEGQRLDDAHPRHRRRLQQGTRWSTRTFLILQWRDKVTGKETHGDAGRAPQAELDVLLLLLGDSWLFVGALEHGQDEGHGPDGADGPEHVEDGGPAPLGGGKDAAQGHRDDGPELRPRVHKRPHATALVRRNPLGQKRVRAGDYRTLEDTQR